MDAFASASAGAGFPLTRGPRPPVVRQVALGLDFPLWLSRQSLRNKLIAERLAQGFSTGEVSRAFHLSASRVSQLRRELAASWYAFIGSAADLKTEDDLD